MFTVFFAEWRKIRRPTLFFGTFAAAIFFNGLITSFVYLMMIHPMAMVIAAVASAGMFWDWHLALSTDLPLSAVCSESSSSAYLPHRAHRNTPMELFAIFLCVNHVDLFC